MMMFRKYHLSHRIGTALILVMLADGARAESLLPPQALPAPLSATIHEDAATTGPDAVELAALYYYARLDQKDRVEREIQRISLKFPSFTVPEDLFRPTDETTVDETSLWRLYEQDDYPGIEREITRLAAANPGWEPSIDFRDKVARRKLRHDMTEATAAKDWAAVIAAGKDLDPTQERDVDLLWLLIDAYKGSAMGTTAAPIYRGILFRKDESRFSDDVILTTLQKAVDDFPAAELRQVMRILSDSTDLAARMQVLTLDLMRREIADYAAGLTDAGEPAPITLLTVRRAAEASGDAKDQRLLGWYYLKIKQYQEAETWFGRSLSAAPSAEALKGLVLGLLAEGRAEEAFRQTAAHLDVAATEWDGFLGGLSYPFQAKGAAPVEPPVAKAYAEAIQSAQSPEHAEILGWYAYNSRQFDVAAAWFGKSFDWKPTETSLKGRALTLIQQKDKKALEALRSQHEAAYPQVFADLKSAVQPTGAKGQAIAGPSSQAQPRYLASFRAKRFGDCMADLLRLESSKGALTGQEQLIRGWCSLGLERLSEARRAFEAALSMGPGKSDDAAYGLGLTLLRAKLTVDAEQVLSRYTLTPDRERELKAEILWQRARSAFDSKRYADVLAALNLRLQIAPEAVGMSQMRAWAHYHLGNLGQSRAIFTELNKVVQDPANQRGLTSINERMGIYR
jgi:tetratricopeptide (TPR) repeat protein